MADSDTQHGRSSPEGKVHKHTEQEASGQDEARADELCREVSTGASPRDLRGREPPTGRLGQFLYGLSLPFHIGSAVLGDPVARKQYIRVASLQSIAALALALSCMTSGTEAAESASRREARAEAKARSAQVRKAAAALAERHVRKAEATTAQRVKEVEAQTAERLRAIDAQLARRQQAEVVANGAPPPGEAERTGTSSDGAAQPAEGTDSERSQDARLEERIRDLEEAAQGSDTGSSLSEAITALVLEVARNVDEEDASGAAEEPPGQDTPARTPDTAQAPQPDTGPSWRLNGFSVWTLAFWAALFAALQLAQWVVIALSRDYHDAISRQASLLTGLEPEEEDVPPRVRVNFIWLRKKLKRRWRAFMLLMAGVPAALVLTVPFVCGYRTVFSVLFTAWSAWWWVVFTAAKSSRAWEPGAAPVRQPWFLRAWTWLTTRVPGLRWVALQRYGAQWSRRTEEVFAPIASTERHPWAFAGLAVVRFIGSFPPMKFFVRPLIPVASAHLLADDVAAAKKAHDAEGKAEPPPGGVPRPSDVW